MEYDLITPPPSNETTDNLPIITNAIQSVTLLEEVKTVIETNLNTNQLKYEKGQWSPSNPNGRKYYQFEQLQKLRSEVLSHVIPINFIKISESTLKQIRNQSRFDSRGRINSYNFPQKSLNTVSSNSGSAESVSGVDGSGSNVVHPSSNLNENTLLPYFARNANHSQRGGQYHKRASQKQKQSNNIGGGAAIHSCNNNKGLNNSRMIHVALALREDVKLNKTANAWKKTSSIVDNINTKTSDKRTTDDLFKRVRGILNKLTPEKFSPLVTELKLLTIDTPQKLSGVIELIFEKAIDEPNFASVYSQLCNSLSVLHVNTQSKNNVPQTFRKELLVHCQKEFERIAMDTKSEELLKVRLI